jgi:hypothetical protein
MLPIDSTLGLNRDSVAPNVSINMKNHWIAAAALAIAALVSIAYAQATSNADTLPNGWKKGGSGSRFYDISLQMEPTTPAQNSLQIKSRPEAGADMYGVAVQRVQAADYLGKKLRFSALVRARDVKGGARLWVRIDDTDNNVIAFDNLEGRNIDGTMDWKRYDIVLAVADKAAMISFGLLLNGTGETAMRELSLDIAPDSTATTSSPMRAPLPVIADLPKQPVNLDFKL